MTQEKQIELDQIKNATLIHFKDEHGKDIDGKLIIGEIEEIKKQNFERPKEIQVKRNLGKFKKVLAYLGIIKSTKKVTITEIYREEVVSKEKGIVGIHSLGDFKNDKTSINHFVQELKNYKKSKAYDFSGKEVGHISIEGQLVRNENVTIDFNETILQKDGQVFAIEKNGKFLDLKGKALLNQNQFIHKGSKVYYLDKQFKETTLKKEAKKIGTELKIKQNKDNFAGINKPKAGAKLTPVKTPIVPTRSK